MAVSDVLFEAEDAIRAYQHEGIITDMDDPEVNLVVDIMRAVRLKPGRDRWPDAPDTFAADLDAALQRYRRVPLTALVRALWDALPGGAPREAVLEALTVEQKTLLSAQFPEGRLFIDSRWTGHSVLTLSIWDMTADELQHEADRRRNVGEIEHADELDLFRQLRTDGVIHRHMKADALRRVVSAAKAERQQAKAIWLAKDTAE